MRCSSHTGCSGPSGGSSSRRGGHSSSSGCLLAVRQPGSGRYAGMQPAQARSRAPMLAEGGKPSKLQVNKKYLVLVLLVLQNSLTAILARGSRMPRPDGGLLYLGSVAVLAAEVIKLPVCLGLIARDEGGVVPMLRKVKDQVFVKWRDTLSMGIPALCYCLQNALFFVALSRLSATSYQLWSQSKTLFTALFFTSYLGRVRKRGRRRCPCGARHPVAARSPRASASAWARPAHARPPALPPSRAPALATLATLACRCVPPERAHACVNE